LLFFVDLSFHKVVEKKKEKEEEEKKKEKKRTIALVLFFFLVLGVGQREAGVWGVVEVGVGVGFGLVGGSSAILLLWGGLFLLFLGRAGW
jgi:preprotein translocase subunit SecY